VRAEELGRELLDRYQADGEPQELRAILAAYHLVAEGKPLVDVEVAIRTAPRDELGRPLLAVARSDRDRVRLHGGWGELTMSAHHPRARNITRSPLLTFTFPQRARHYWPDSWSPVPAVPLSMRPKRDGAFLRRHVTLFEVSAWNEVFDLDPLLLLPVYWPICAVVGAWDLTPIEAAILQAAARRGP
jgi:hypothetical protein